MDQIMRLKARLTAMGETTDDELLEELLATASDVIMSIRYPFGEWPDELEKQYLGLQIRIALDLYNKQGAEGETSHSENGVNRTYGAENVSSDLLAEITPKAGVL